MSDAPDHASPRALVAIGTFVLEVGLGTLFGALAIRTAASSLGDVKREVAVFLIAALALWCALLAGAMRLARAHRARLHPAVGLVVLALPALGLVAPVVLHFASTPRGGTNPFEGWDDALTTAGQTLEVGSLFGALVWGAMVPFVLVGAPLASRPRAPLWALGVLGACGGYLGLAITCRLLEATSPVLVFGVRHVFLVGVPLAVIGLGLVASPRSGRRRVIEMALAVVAASPLISATLCTHPRHLVSHLVLVHDRTTLTAVCRRIDPSFWIEPLGDHRASVRSRALGALAIHGHGAAAAAPALLHLAQHDDELFVRWDALHALRAVVAGTPGDPALWNAVFELATDSDYDVRNGAHSFIVGHAHPAVAEALVAAIVEANQRGTGAAARRDLGPALVGWWSMRGFIMSKTDQFLRTVLLICGADQRGASGFLRDMLSRESLIWILRQVLKSPDPAARRLAATTLREVLDPSAGLTFEERRLLDAELAE